MHTKLEKVAYIDTFIGFETYRVYVYTHTDRAHNHSHSFTQ